MLFEKSIKQEAKENLDKKLKDLEQAIHGDVLFLNIDLFDSIETYLKDIVEKNKKDTVQNDTCFVILTTYGGSITAVERVVTVLRENYKQVKFIIPDHAYSAGTILVMSGDELFMDYFGVLGPIDPQVQTKDGKWVSALGYLDKLNELIKKANSNSLTPPEFLIIKEFDLGMWRSYEQARDLSISVLKEYLVKYHFHSIANNGIKIKKKQADEIAKKLGNNSTWLSHGRPINKEVLQKMGVLISDIQSQTWASNLTCYLNYVKEYMDIGEMKNFIHSRSF